MENLRNKKVLRLMLFIYCMRKYIILESKKSDLLVKCRNGISERKEKLLTEMIL